MGFSLYFITVVRFIPFYFLSGYEWDILLPNFSQQGSDCSRKAIDFYVLILWFTTLLQEFISSISFLMMFLGIFKYKIVMCMKSEALASFFYIHLIICIILLLYKVLNTILNKSRESVHTALSKLKKNALTFSYLVWCRQYGFTECNIYLACMCSCIFLFLVFLGFFLWSCVELWRVPFYWSGISSNFLSLFICYIIFH